MLFSIKNDDLCFLVNLTLSDSYDDSQVQYEWIKVSLKEHDMTEFYVEKQILRLESTSSITGSSGIYCLIIILDEIRLEICPRYLSSVMILILILTRTVTTAMVVIIVMIMA